MVDCCYIHHTLGLVSHTDTDMDLPSERNHWSDAVSNTARRTLLLRYSDLHYQLTLPSCKQADVASDLLAWRARVARWRTLASMEDGWADLPDWHNTVGCAHGRQ